MIQCKIRGMLVGHRGAKIIVATILCVGNQVISFLMQNWMENLKITPRTPHLPIFSAKDCKIYPKIGKKQRFYRFFIFENENSNLNIP